MQRWSHLDLRQDLEILDGLSSFSRRLEPSADEEIMDDARTSAIEDTQAVSSQELRQTFCGLVAFSRLLSARQLDPGLFD